MAQSLSWMLPPELVCRRHKHPLTLGKSLQNWNCDVCRFPHNIGQNSWRCELCDYDECPKCYPLMSGSTKPLRHVHSLQCEYVSFPCGECKVLITGGAVGYQCALCSVVECVNCRGPLLNSTQKRPNTSLHAHPLTKCRPYSSNQFSCDVCSVLYEGKESFHCTPCSFDVCDACMQRQELHEHTWGLVLPVWKCDLCELNFAGERMAYHCRTCSYSECDHCFPRHTGSQFPYHEHPLKPEQPFYNVPGYKCDLCSSHYGPGVLSWHCPECKYDECHLCYTTAH